MCGFKLLLLLLQAPRGGDKSLVEVLLFQLLLWDDECLVIPIALLFGDRLVIGVFGIAVIRQGPRTVFTITLLVRLHCWVRGFFIVFGVVRGVIPSCAGIAVFTMAWF